jgi:dihydroorotase
VGLLIKNGEMIDPEGKLQGKMDVLVEGGAIAKIKSDIKPNSHTVIDASGLWMFPGFIDIHVHLRDPGYEYKETIETGLRAAVRGGFTTVACMPNTNPPVDNKSVVKYIRDRAMMLGIARLLVVGSISKGRKGEELAEIGDMAAEGIVGVSDDGAPVMSSQLMRRALEYVKIFGLPVISHPEDMGLSSRGLMHEGYVSTLMGLRGIPAAAEETMVARDIALAELTGGRLHLTHLSTKNSVELVRAARKRGVPVTCDVTPHHLALTDEAVMGFDTAAKVNPPLRPMDHVEALRAALMDGTVDAVASDHAPHAVHEKEASFDEAPFGLVGLETTLGVLLTLVPGLREKPGLLAALLTTGPARVLGLPRPGLFDGAAADLTLVDPEEQWVVRPETFASLGRNCPFAGRTLRGRVRHTVSAGRLVVRDGELTEVD